MTYRVSDVRPAATRTTGLLLYVTECGMGFLLALTLFMVSAASVSDVQFVYRGL